MAKKKTTKKKSKAQEMLEYAEHVVQEQVENIDEALDKINKRLKVYESLIEKRNQLQAARRALLGGNTLTGAGGSRLRMDDVAEYVKENPGKGPTEIAEHFGVPYATAAGHLYRGTQAGRFINKDKKYWLRDPENGLDTADDIDEDQEDDDE